jgi:hypothetical protein
MSEADPQSTSLEALQSRIDALLQLRKRRWRLVQLPLLCLALACAALAVVFPLAIATPAGEDVVRDGWLLIPPLLAGFVMLLALLPADGAMLRVFVLAFAGIGVYVMTLVARDVAHAVADGARGGRDGGRRGAEAATTATARVVLGSVGLGVCGCALLALARALGCRRDASASARLEAAWRAYSAFALGVALAEAGALVAAAPDAAVATGLAPAVVHLVGHVATCLLAGLVALCLGGWPGVRARVHRFLMGRRGGGDGGLRRGAAGIAETLDGVRASEVLRNAEASFLAVRMDRLTYLHLCPPERQPTRAPAAAGADDSGDASRRGRWDWAGASSALSGTFVGGWRARTSQGSRSWAPRCLTGGAGSAAALAQATPAAEGGGELAAARAAASAAARARAAAAQPSSANARWSSALPLPPGSPDARSRTVARTAGPRASGPSAARALFARSSGVSSAAAVDASAGAAPGGARGATAAATDARGDGGGGCCGASETFEPCGSLNTSVRSMPPHSPSGGCGATLTRLTGRETAEARTMVSWRDDSGSGGPARQGRSGRGCAGVRRSFGGGARVAPTGSSADHSSDCATSAMATRLQPAPREPAVTEPATLGEVDVRMCVWRARARLRGSRE